MMMMKMMNVTKTTIYWRKKYIYRCSIYTEKNVAKILGTLWDQKYNKLYIPENVESRLILAIWNEYLELF